MQKRLVVISVLAVLAGCGHKKRHEAPPADAAAPPVATVSVDGKAAIGLSRDLFVARRPLASAVPGLPPPEKWRMVTATNGKGGNLYLRNPSVAYEHQTIKLYLGVHGEPAIGMFRPPSPTPPPARLRSIARAPSLFLTGITAIEIRTQEEKVPPPPQASLQLRVGNAAPVSIAQADLDGVKKTDPPGDPGDARGWRLVDVLAKYLPAGGSPAVHVVAEDGALDLPAGTLTDEHQLVYLKVNRRGLFRLQWWRDRTDRRSFAGELRGVSAIEVSTDRGTPRGNASHGSR